MRSPTFGFTTWIMARISGRGVYYSPPFRPAFPFAELRLVEMRQLVFSCCERKLADRQLKRIAQR